MLIHNPINFFQGVRWSRPIAAYKIHVSWQVAENRLEPIEFKFRMNERQATPHAEIGGRLKSHMARGYPWILPLRAFWFLEHPQHTLRRVA